MPIPSSGNNKGLKHTAKGEEKVLVYFSISGKVTAEI